MFSATEETFICRCCWNYKYNSRWVIPTISRDRFNNFLELDSDDDDENDDEEEDDDSTNPTSVKSSRDLQSSGLEDITSGSGQPEDDTEHSENFV